MQSGEQRNTGKLREGLGMVALWWWWCLVVVGGSEWYSSVDGGGWE